MTYEEIDEEEKAFDNSRLAWFDKKQVTGLPALLVGVHKGPKEEAEAKEHLEELALLAETHGITTIEALTLSIRTLSAATFLSEGKLADLKEAVEKFGAKLVVFDDDITPAQQRNLEAFLRVPVIDRTEVILGVFADRARTKEAKLQIELAQVKYIAPRLKRMWTHLSRQSGTGSSGGGGAYLKGEGEKQIEIDRRILKRKLERLQRQIKEVSAYRQTQRTQRMRTEIPTFAIVGYTNAGKSTLMKALTKADVFIEDKLFATLDTTTRKFVLPDTNQELLLIDTVGFIRKLPHLLVTAFKSTLEEAAQADILIHVIDTSNDVALEQSKTTLKVLKELNAGDKPVITCFNKMDRVRAPEATGAMKKSYQQLRLTYPRAVEMSASSGMGIDALLAEMKLMVQDRRARLTLCVPQSDYHVIAKALSLGKVFSQEYEENSVIVDLEVPRSQVFHFEPYLKAKPEEQTQEEQNQEY